MMARLGRRQVDVLRAAAEGRSYVLHQRQGRMAVSGLDDVYDDDVLDSLLRRGLIDLVENATRVGRHDVVLTEAGVAALADVEVSS